MKTNLTRKTGAIFCTLLLLLINFTLQSQVIEAAPVHLRAWAKTPEMSPHPVPSVVNDSIGYFLHNNHFRTVVERDNNTGRGVLWYDTSEIRSRIEKEVMAPFKLPDFVYFDPLECFQKPDKGFITKNKRSRKELGRYRRLTDRYNRQTHQVPIPYALRFYLDTSRITSVPGQTHLYLEAEADLLPEPFLKPFYFRKYQVSNAEYREFVNYVKDSIARTILFEAGMSQYGRIEKRTDADGNEIRMLLLDYAPKISWNMEEIDSILEVMYLPEEERYYRRKEINSKILVYRSQTLSTPDNTLAIYPDTSAWIRDFPVASMEPFTRNYFWHYVYDNYPVVGVNYWQALAYLDWKTRMVQQELDRRGIRLKVVCDLPTEAEWDMVATAGSVDGKPELYPRHYQELADQSWITSLQLSDDRIERIDSTDRTLWEIHHRPNLLTEALEGPSRTRTFRNADEFYYTHQTGIADKTGKKGNRKSPIFLPDPNDIYGMGSNASEWLKDTYNEQWLPVFTLRQEMLSSFTDPEMVLLAQLEQYYNGLNDTNGHLVRGANWFDRRYFSLYGKNITGMQAKRFVAPDKTHSTLGFRYVMRFEEY